MYEGEGYIGGTSILDSSKSSNGRILMHFYIWQSICCQEDIGHFDTSLAPHELHMQTRGSHSLHWVGRGVVGVSSAIVILPRSEATLTCLFLEDFLRDLFAGGGDGAHSLSSSSLFFSFLLGTASRRFL